MRITRWGALALVPVLLLAACGDDDEATDAAAGGDTEVAAEHAEYCEKSAALDEQDGPPTNEQLAELQEVAPEEIAAEIAVVAEVFEEKGLDAFVDGRVHEAFEVIEPWENEHCPGADHGEDEEPLPQEPDPDATQVTVTATDFDFAIEGEVPAGKVAFVMQNEGQEPHHMSIVKFKDGTTMEQAEAAIEGGLNELQPLIDEDVELGESTDAEPGATAVLNADLEPGLYGMACFVASEDKELHFAKGMRIAFEVR